MPNDLLLTQHLDGDGNFVGGNPGGVATLADVLPDEAVSAPPSFPSLARSRQLIPAEALKPGEQYRFHFNASKCIGCECCVVGCQEQNGNPAEVRWRKVGEVEGGTYPATKRHHLSMACNHCTDPACLTGCPTDAYEKDPATGIVRHKADACIGCQYCIWNCPYDVPVFNKERGIVTKCDMCYGRLGTGSAPACVASCPEEALSIEKVNIAEWKADHAQADAPGMPDSGTTISTTRITFPQDMPSDTLPVDLYRLEPEDPHTPLIFLTVLTQLSVGAFFAVWLLELLGGAIPSLSAFPSFMGAGAMASLFAGCLALGASIFHLGRPLYAWKALKMWRRSWLSREVLLFGVFSGLAMVYAGLWLEEVYLGSLGLPDWVRTLAGAAVVASGLAGVYASGRIYMVPARPAWNTPRTLARFFLTGWMLGPAFILSVYGGWKWWFMQTGQAATLHWPPAIWLGIFFVASALQLGLLLTSFFRLVWREEPELRGTAVMLARRFKNIFVGRIAAVALGGLVLPAVLAYLLFASTHTAAGWIFACALAALGLSLIGEFLGRYLFFVTVVPKGVAGSFLRQ